MRWRHALRRKFSVAIVKCRDRLVIPSAAATAHQVVHHQLLLGLTGLELLGCATEIATVVLLGHVEKESGPGTLLRSVPLFNQAVALGAWRVRVLMVVID